MFGFKALSKVFTGSKAKAEPKTDDSGWTIFGSGINPNWGQGWWQKALSDPRQSARVSPAVEACVGHISRASAMLPLEHYKLLPKGGRERIKDSPIFKVLRKPNAYQTRSDFMLNLVRGLLFAGNGYAVAVRDDNNKIKQLHLLPSTGTRHYVDDDAEVYYHVSGNKLSGVEDMLVPAREVLHIRTQTAEGDPLRGVSPIESAAASVSAGNSINGHNSSFFNNMSRPSGVIQTDLELDADQTKALRKRWEEQSTLLNSGKTPVLSHGLHWQPLSLTATDAELVNFYRLSIEDIARVFGVPSALINIDSSSSTFSNVESLLNMWVSTSLGSLIDSLELSFEDLFDIPEDERINFDMEYLLRGDLKNRMESFGKGILSGIYSINEARDKEGLGPIDGGDEPRIQQQNVPLTYYEDDLDLKRGRLDLDRDVADNNAKSSDGLEDDDSNEPTPSGDGEKSADDIISQIKRAMV
jgi:HK97 family phage portal protein